ncbi:MAG: hypothetical protein OXC69_03275 [Candidatus Tectomicrobia bacterium]|nr:hypothetical protein [Candidatus Tectomicrobia bacterium]
MSLRNLITVAGQVTADAFPVGVEVRTFPPWLARDRMQHGMKYTDVSLRRVRQNSLKVNSRQFIAAAQLQIDIRELVRQSAPNIYADLLDFASSLLVALSQNPELDSGTPESDSLKGIRSARNWELTQPPDTNVDGVFGLRLLGEVSIELGQNVWEYSYDGHSPLSPPTVLITPPLRSITVGVDGNDVTLTPPDA